MKPWSALAQVVYKRTYARKIADGGVERLETYPETVDRYIKGNTDGFLVPEEEKERLRYFGLQRKAGPAGRGLWFSGTDAHKRLGGVAANNCYFETSADWRNFVIALDLLMLGGGVGMSVEHKYTSKLPRIKKGVKVVCKNTNDADFIVPDSREGWCQLTHRVLEAYFATGKGFSYSTVCVRGYGEPIKGFGGTASGPLPLVAFIEKVCEILTSREGKSMRPLDAADILCCIGEMVVAGNVRRSALIIIGDGHDKEFLKAKRWDLGSIPTQRSCANWSVVCEDVEDLHPLYWKTYEAGEAFGLINLSNIQKYGRMGELLKDSAIGVNPCQPAWATVLTPDGIRTIGEIGVDSVIWSGKRWTKVVKKWSTGVKPVNAYRTRSGVFYGTENHRIVSGGEKIEVSEADSIDISVGPTDYSGERHPNAIMDGLMIGDGTWHSASGKNFLIVGKNDQSWLTELPNLFGQPSGAGPGYWNVVSSLPRLPKTYERKVPDFYKNAQADIVCSFLRGLYSANGSIVGNRVTLKASSFEMVEDVQQMLSSIGIASYYTTNKSHDVKFDNGTYTCRESYDVNIATLTSRQLFAKNIGFIQPYKQAKLADLCHGKPGKSKTAYDIVEVENLGQEEVFDLTVQDEEHTYWTGGLLVSNCGEATLECHEPCNLADIDLPNLESIEEFEEAAVLMYRYCKRVTCQEYHIPEVDEVVKRNRRIGISITGCLQSPLFTPENLDRVYRAIKEEDAAYSAELGVPTSIRLTTIKPSGTKSKMTDVDGEGIHCGYSRYMIQRVRFSSDDKLLPYLRAAGHYMEPVVKLDGSFDHGTTVVDFYRKMPGSLPCADEGFDTWQQLDKLLLAQKYWSDQAVSVTVYYKREEIQRIKDWLAENLKNLKTISFLCHSGHGFKQAPKEAITKEQYERAVAKLKPLELDGFDGGTGDVLEGMECAGGACPIR